MYVFFIIIHNLKKEKYVLILWSAFLCHTAGLCYNYAGLVLFVPLMVLLI